jgi:hypothetical protein
MRRRGVLEHDRDLLKKRREMAIMDEGRRQLAGCRSRQNNLAAGEVAEHRRCRHVQDVGEQAGVLRGDRTRREQLAGTLGDGAWPWLSEAVEDERAKISSDGEETKASTGEARRKASCVQSRSGLMMSMHRSTENRALALGPGRRRRRTKMGHASVRVEDGRRSACSVEACRDDEEATGKQEREAGGASPDLGDGVLRKREAEKSGGARTGPGLGLRLEAPGGFL